MKPITYLAFTILSIVIQFCVVDLIQEKLQPDNDKLDLNLTTPKKELKDILDDMNQRPHALYYRAYARFMDKEPHTPVKYKNASLPEITLETSSELTTTILDFLYDENSSLSYESSTYSEITTATSELDNVTEITFFNKKNATSKPDKIPKRTFSKDCSCNLYYKICDIKCCCDRDCSEAERHLFGCSDKSFKGAQGDNVCRQNVLFESGFRAVDDLFCVLKDNLPAKRNIVQNKHDPDTVLRAFKWHTAIKSKIIEEFKKKIYKPDDPIWLMKNGSIYFVDLPSPLINNYCTERAPVKFLKNVKIQCNVKLRDLEIFHIMNTLESSKVISVTEATLNSSALNCSTLHCANWTVIVCDKSECMKYDNKVHTPVCNESFCTNLALKVDYTYYCFESKILNATLKMYTETVSLNLPFITQEISVKFVVANDTLKDIVTFSGNPGYITGLPVIVSYAESNYTDDFYNTSKRHYLSYPDNSNGECVVSPIANKYILFGLNKRMKCRYYHVFRKTSNGTKACQNIQDRIIELLGINNKAPIVVSPVGNPSELKDEGWIDMQLSINEEIYGEFRAQRTQLRCNNLMTRISFIFTFTDMSQTPVRRENKILSSRVVITGYNGTFNVDDISTVLSVDTIFIDETKQVIEYAGGPHLDIHLPKDFFFPFPSSKSYFLKHNMRVTLFVAIFAVTNK